MQIAQTVLHLRFDQKRLVIHMNAIYATLVYKKKIVTNKLFLKPILVFSGGSAITFSSTLCSFPPEHSRCRKVSRSRVWSVKSNHRASASFSHGSDHVQSNSKYSPEGVLSSLGLRGEKSAAADSNVRRRFRTCDGRS